MYNCAVFNANPNGVSNKQQKCRTLPPPWQKLSNCITVRGCIRIVDAATVRN